MARRRLQHAYHAPRAGVREGIRPAVECGVVAARTLITANGRFKDDDLRPYETAMHAAHGASTPPPKPLTPLVKAAGRTLMRSHMVTRRVILDGWFLRSAQ